MAELNYEDFKRRINIQDLLIDAGYSLNKCDGLRYPSYVRMESDGRRVRGDKFIVTGNGLCCFQPPEQKNYNVISFIKEHPHFFSEYTPGMNTDRLVNLVCNRLLNHPIDRRPSVVAGRERSEKVFDLQEYKRLDFRKDDWDSQKAFYPYFKSRGITLDAQRAFSNNFFITMRETSNGKTYTNLSFPLRKPNDLATIVGLEERGRANAEGKAIYKGMAAGSNATEGMWIASPSGETLDKVKNVYWFEGAYDAMAFYQITKNELKNGKNRDSKKELSRLDKSVFVSTGGNPSIHQFKGMIAETPEANHHLCFDRDRAGQMFAINFALTKAGKTFNTHVTPKGKLIVVDTTDKYQQHELNPELFEFNRLLKILGADAQTQRSEMTEYMESLRNKEDIFSGDEYLLPPDLLKAYGRYEVACEEFHSAKYSGLVCKEDLEDIGDELKTSYEAYKAAMKNAASQYESAGRTIYQPCEKEYKDWNDQLLDKKIATEEDNVVNKASENSVLAGNTPEERDEENNEEEERTCHFHR
ncbi:toprim domain-containing protein [Parabacteroides sp. BX2]|uniref:Toprim domain-containing protein n=1 Tax=Parabacteroides segnis TaxID=2763058 RepID=A0ABR7DWE5_9BACT|nr:toprim domain-containing protein [Parabacteroides segnis]MBC5641852.1 toprim domain-containing protein [Parabacteroides segnis]